MIAVASWLALAQAGHPLDDALRDWQTRMLRARAETPAALRRVLDHRIPVPAPRRDGTPEGATVRMDFGSTDPLGLLPAPVITSRIGHPTVRVAVQGKASVHDVFVAEHKRLLWISPDAGEAAFRTPETCLGVEAGPEGPFRPLGKLLFGVAGHDLAFEGPETGFEMKTAWIGGELTIDREGRLKAAVQVGPDLVPAAFRGLAEARLQLAAEASAPVVVQDVQWRSRWGAAQVASGAAAEVARLLAGRIACAYCSGGGAVTCRQCADRKTIACPDCARRGRTACASCSGHGRFSCETLKACGRCSGSGIGRCGGCGGDGTITEYDTVPGTQTRTLRRPVEAGFDPNGRPILRMETYTIEVETTRTVSRQVACGSCGGSGQGGACGRCGGNGSVVCGRCDGTGRTACDDCEGVGSKTCSRCRGRLDLTCPTCDGRSFACPLCKGQGTVGR